MRKTYVLAYAVIILVRPKRFSAQEALAVVTTINEDDSGDENNGEVECEDPYSTKDGTKWILIEETGRRSIQNVLTEQPGLTHYAKRMIDSPLSAFQNNWLIRRCSVISRSVQKQKLEMF